MPEIQVYQVQLAGGKPSAIAHLPELSAGTLDEVTRQLPAGVYTTFRTYQKTSVLLLQEHFDRLEESARLIGARIRLERNLIRAELRRLIQAHPAVEVRVRLCIPIIENHCLLLYVMLEDLRLPDAKDYLDGVCTITKVMKRDQPAAKWSGFIEKTSPIRELMILGINEILMIDAEGRFLEGLSSNFFAVRGGVIYTAEGNVLAGITRKFILEIIAELDIPVILEGYPVKELNRMEEAFISSTSRGVLPVSHIDEMLVGNGQPGRITRQIVGRFCQRIETHLDAI